MREMFAYGHPLLVDWQAERPVLRNTCAASFVAALLTPPVAHHPIMAGMPMTVAPQQTSALLPRLSPTQEKVYGYLSGHKPVSPRALAIEMGLHEYTVRNSLLHLVSIGLVSKCKNLRINARLVFYWRLAA